MKIQKKVAALEDGDILAEAVYDSSGQPVLNEGQKIDAGTRQRLENAGVEGIKSIAIESATSPLPSREAEEQYNFIGVDSERVFDAEGHCLKIDSPRIKAVHQGLVDFTENVLSAISSDKAAEFSLDDVRSNVTQIMDEITNNPAAMMGLVHLRDVDKYTFMHSVDVAVLSLMLGKELKLENQRLQDLGTGAILHDIGKMAIDLKVLNKPGKLNEEEFAEIKNHTERGYRILQEHGLENDVAFIALSHHEKLNGRGYPLALDENRIPLYSRIVSVVDIYDALTADRVYKKAMHPAEAFEIMFRGEESELDSKLLHLFRDLMGYYPVSSLVLLSDGSLARVIDQNRDAPSHPVIEILSNRYGNEPKKHTIVDTNQSSNYSISGMYKGQR